MKGFLLEPGLSAVMLPEAAENLEDELRARHPRVQSLNPARVHALTPSTWQEVSGSLRPPLAVRKVTADQTLLIISAMRQLGEGEGGGGHGDGGGRPTIIFDICLTFYRKRRDYLRGRCCQSHRHHTDEVEHSGWLGPLGGFRCLRMF